VLYLSHIVQSPAGPAKTQYRTAALEWGTGSNNSLRSGAEHAKIGADWASDDVTPACPPEGLLTAAQGALIGPGWTAACDPEQTLEYPTRVAAVLPIADMRVLAFVSKAAPASAERNQNRAAMIRPSSARLGQ
jgi:hypothetical protein